jgi:hypothetical protein
MKEAQQLNAGSLYHKSDSGVPGDFVSSESYFASYVGRGVAYGSVGMTSTLDRERERIADATSAPYSSANLL